MVDETSDPMLTASDCASLLGVSVTTFWRWIAGGRAPKPIKLGKLSRWPKSEILGLMQRAKAARQIAA
ncbi:DNA-binding protein [Bradyrhizobium sp. 160]|nr:DNA-binding protein [Bradyrhizobium sp. 160]